MVNFSDCYIAKVKSFFGFKSIDPPLPFAEFIQKHQKDLKTLIKNGQIIAFDDQGNEIDIALLETYVHASYQEIFNTSEHQQDNKEELKDEINNYQKELERIKSITSEEKAKLEHKQRLIESLQGCDETYRLILEQGIARNDDKIKVLQEERQSLLNLINGKPDNT